MKKSSILLLCVGLLLLLQIPGYARGPAGLPPSGSELGIESLQPNPTHHFRPPHDHYFLEEQDDLFRKKLNLSEDQVKELRTQFVNFREKTRKARIALASLRDEKLTMILSGKIDRERLAAIDDETVKLITELARERLKMKRDRLAILTPDQLNKLGDLLMQKRHRHHERWR